MLPSFLLPNASLPLHHPYRRALCASRSKTTSLARMSLDSEDDDGSIGVPSKKYGIQLPNFSIEDQKYLDEAKNHTEFVARLAQLARIKEEERKRHDGRSGAQISDDYIESLRRPPRDFSGSAYDGKGKSTADDYIASLNVRVPPDTSAIHETNVRINSAENYIQNLTRGNIPKNSNQDPSEDTKNAVKRVENLMEFLREREGVNKEDLKEESQVDMLKIDEDIADLESSIEKTVYEKRESGNPLDENITQLETQISKIQQESAENFIKFTKESTELNVPETPVSRAINEDPELHAMETNVEGLDKQIRFMEQYLQKLQTEQEAEAKHEGSPISDKMSMHEVKDIKTMFDAQLKNMEKAVSKFPQKIGGSKVKGDMTEAERLEAFQAIRMQALKQRGSGVPEFTDPLAVPLPERKIDVPRHEYNDSDSDIDINKPSISTAYFMVSELEAEIKKYLFDAKSLLREHEDRMKEMLEKLKELD